MFQVFTQGGFGLITVLLFIAALLLMEGLYLLWRGYRGPEVRRLSRRMQAVSAGGGTGSAAQVLKGTRMSKVPGLDRWMSGSRRMQALQCYLVQADVSWTVSELMLASAVLGLLGAGAGSASPLPGLLPVLGPGMLLAALPWMFVTLLHARRLAKIQRQLPDALDFLIRALRSGQAFTSALSMAGEELPDPIAVEFRAAHDEITFGTSVEQALTHLSERVPITDVRYFVVSVMIQRESGGNLTEVLGNLSRLIRERYKLIAKVGVLSADGRMSAWILALFPFALGGFMYMMQPNFIRLLWTDPMGIVILKALLMMMLMGFLILRKIVKIRV